ncbi:hypothetical protein [Methylobacterium sp. D48H]
MSKIDFTTLRASVEKGLLIEQRIGHKNILSAVDRSITDFGLDVITSEDTSRIPTNFRRFRRKRHAFVAHDGKCARLRATVSEVPCYDPYYEYGEKYPRNFLAEDLFSQNSTRGDNGDPTYGVVYGDALLFTNIKSYWWVNQNLLTDDEIMINEMDIISTKSVIATRGAINRSILLLEPPLEEDLVSLELLLS